MPAWVLFMACQAASSRDASHPGDAEPDAGWLDATADAQTSDAGITPDAGEAAHAEVYCESIVSFFCDFYLRCGRVVAPDAATCRTYFLSACNERYEPRYVALERAGLLELSPAGIATCRTHLSSVQCEAQIRDLDGPCDAMWFGKSPAGSPCGLDVESFVCGPGTSCVLGLDLCGECRSKASLGEACGSGTVCGSSAECLEGSCVARPEPGQSCGAEPSCVLGASCVAGTCQGPSYVGAAAACDRERRCAYGSTCVGGVCVAGGGYGDPCAGDRPCALGRCLGSACAPLAHEGDACATALDCAEGPCASGRCQSLPGACF